MTSGNDDNGTRSPSEDGRQADSPLKARPPRKRDFARDVAPVVQGKIRIARSMLRDGMDKVVPQRQDAPERWYFKLLGLSFAGLMVVGGLSALLAFLLTLKSPEMVNVPDVRGTSLVESLEMLQDYGLLGRVRQKVSTDTDKGLVLEQEPAPGRQVRVGRAIDITVSKGNLADELGSYVGRSLEEVRQEIKARYVGDNPRLTSGNVSWVYSDLGEGTIISQDPAPGTPLGTRLTVSFLVSRGADAAAIEVPDLGGKSYRDVMDLLGNRGIPFRFVPASDGVPGFVVGQTPVSGETLHGGEVLEVDLALPVSSDKSRVAGFFTMELPDYSVPVEITVYNVDATGGQSLVYSFRSLGGTLNFPWVLPVDSELVVQAIGREIKRVRIAAPEAAQGN